MLDAVSGLIANARRLTMTVPWASERARVEHQRLYDAICAHDPEAAAAIMGTHLDSAIAGDRRGPQERGRGARLTITPARGPRRTR